MRDALEAAWVVARAGVRAVPPVAAPRPLRPLLGHARLTPTARATIRNVLDEDAEFRARVAEAVDETVLGRAATLFLARPEGWEEELAALVEASASDAAAEEEGRAERAATRRLKGAEEALRRAEDLLAGERAQAARLGEELARERAARRLAEEAAARDAAEAERLRGRVAALEEESAAAAGGPAADVVAGEPVVVEVEVPVPYVPAEVVEAVAEASEAARVVHARLTDAAAALVRATTPPPHEPGDDGQVDAAVGRRSARRPPRRMPATLPPAVFEDSPEAAEHLVRCRDAVLLIDGYNASLAYRPELPIPEQRRRLVDAVDELVARTGVEAHVVFDGADVGDDDSTVRVGGRRLSARVLFSPPDVEADDVILGLVEAVPMSRPVLVASDDRRVQDGARERGANVLSTSQLLGVLRRER